MANYFDIEALSQSGAKTLLKSPAQYRHQQLHSTKPTPAMVFGSLVHALTLEPQTVASLYAVQPDLSDLCDPKTGVPYANPAASTAGKAVLAEFRAANEGKTVVSADDMATATEMSVALLTAVHPRLGLTLADLLALKSARVEEEVVWTDAETGAACKAKLDAVVPLADGSVLAVDLKTTTADLTTADLSRTVATFGYAPQASWYLTALAQGGVVDAQFWFLFVQRQPPHETAWITLDGDALTSGAQTMRAAKRIYAACTSSGNWPSAQGAGLLGDTISLPKWARSDWQED